MKFEYKYVQFSQFDNVEDKLNEFSQQNWTVHSFAKRQNSDCIDVLLEREPKQWRPTATSMAIGPR